MGELYINGKDAYTEWGVRMGRGFLDELEAFLPLKEYITNDNTTKDGVEYCEYVPKVNEREVTLPFTLKGASKEDYLAKKRAFTDMLYHTQEIVISVPNVSADLFKLRYRNGTSYGRSLSGTFCKFSIKFVEANPADRKIEEESL